MKLANASQVRLANVSQVSGTLSPRKQVSTNSSPKKEIEIEESSDEDDEQILNKLNIKKGNLMQRAVSVYLYKALKEKRKE